MRVRFLGKMPRTAYSGGRLLSIIMAESLAMTGADVDYLVSDMPKMYDEFRSFSRIRMASADFTNLSPLVDRNIDIVVVIPGGIGRIPHHAEWTRHGLECHARIVLLNFESPNWFNEVSPYKKDEKEWDSWDVVSEYASMILSISGEGEKYAREYYNKAPKGCFFEFSYPAINSILADKADFPAKREKQIVLLTRIDHHKGFNTLAPLVHKNLKGYKVTVFLGNGTMQPRELKRWQKSFGKVGMEFEVEQAIIGVDKFKMLKKASLLYFPSRFEGFGIPPLEAAYCLLPCACSDLPVLKEFGRNALVYGDPESVEDMHRAVMEALETGERVEKEHERISKIARMNDYGVRINNLFSKL